MSKSPSSCGGSLVPGGKHLLKHLGDFIHPWEFFKGQGRVPGGTRLWESWGRAVDVALGGRYHWIRMILMGNFMILGKLERPFAAYVSGIVGRFFPRIMLIPTNPHLNRPEQKGRVDRHVMVSRTFRRFFGWLLFFP